LEVQAQAGGRANDRGENSTQMEQESESDQKDVFLSEVFLIPLRVAVQAMP